MNDQYKNRHKPILNEQKTRFKQGYYYPEHPEKCLTSTNVYRSSWEQKFFAWCDRCDQVVRWASEPVKIQYRNPVTNIEFCKKNHLNPKDPHNWKLSNYYTDVWIELRKKDGTGVRKIFIEIKPYAQTQKPAPLKPGAKLKEINAFNRAAQTYLVNTAKWTAAKKEFESRGAEFLVMTEIELKKLGILQY